MKSSENLEILPFIDFSQLPPKAWPVDFEPGATSDRLAVETWLSVTLNALIDAFKLSGELVYFPEQAIAPADDTGTSSLATRWNQQCWSGLGVLKARLWVEAADCYRIYAVTLESPTWLQVCLQLHQATWAAGQRKQSQAEDIPWFTALEHSKEKLQQFGNMPVFSVVFGF